MTDMLEDIFRRQQELQMQRFRNPATLGREDALAFIRTHILACEDELHEALGEVGWKPWASSVHINREAYIAELVDAMHFLVNLFLVVGASAGEVYREYVQKNGTNHARQVAGYTGKKDENGRELDHPQCDGQGNLLVDL